MLSLEHHHFPQTSTVVPFEGNVGEAACKAEWAERTRRSEAGSFLKESWHRKHKLAFTTGFPP
ncbi:hypothetical protein HNR77_002139 [Paenibacillus sp. JGP012]|uniref:hypothetical protein n=1 Tax=Paenibacillus sp. JGP012 TaxID=2735914 RepID=UPI00160D16A2|nr:hypothetical protein [Paenibacillus sp. JGP012]MBB6021058.1 hypothetical protein [Paenibacillus sp. JGP012]